MGCRKKAWPVRVLKERQKTCIGLMGEEWSHAHVYWPDGEDMYITLDLVALVCDFRGVVEGL